MSAITYTFPLDPALAKKRHEQKLRAAREFLGEKWVLHPACPLHYQCPDRMKESRA